MFWLMTDFDFENHDFDFENHDFDFENHDFDFENHNFDFENHDFDLPRFATLKKINMPYAFHCIFTDLQGAEKNIFLY